MGNSASQETLFSLLPKTRTPWTEFVFSTGTQACLIAFLLWLRLLHPAILAAPEHTFRSVQLVSTPVPVNHQPQPIQELPKPVLVANLDPPANALRLPPQPKRVKVEDAPAPAVNIAAKKSNPLPPSAAPVIPKVVAVNTFSTGSSATPTIARAPSQVQTGGFGDPNGIPAKANPGKAVNIAAAGSFDLPSGGGYGNGSGGTKGTPGVVASAGFGAGTAIGDNRPHNSTHSAVQQSGFGDADVPAPPTVHSHSAESADGSAVPAEIVSKPTPDYTQEARKLRIEGEVLLEVVLEASGNLRVKRVVRGLGHGLDDNAVKAAEQIRFRPATRNGQPADSTVVLHIIFQLA
jgi:TonB family protein